MKAKDLIRNRLYVLNAKTYSFRYEEGGMFTFYSEDWTASISLTEHELLLLRNISDREFDEIKRENELAEKVYLKTQNAQLEERVKELEHQEISTNKRKSGESLGLGNMYVMAIILFLIFFFVRSCYS